MLLLRNEDNIQVFSAYQKLIFLIFNQTFIVGTLTLRRFFWAPKTYAKTDG